MRQVLRAGALGRPRGMGWGGRQEGGSGWGTHVNPWLIHVNIRQKPLQYCKVISIHLIRRNEKKQYISVHTCTEYICILSALFLWRTLINIMSKFRNRLFVIKRLQGTTEQGPPS